MTPDEWNQCKSEMPVGSRIKDMTPNQVSLAAINWINDWWKRVVVHLDHCMAEHEKSIFLSTAWAGGEQFIRASNRGQGLVANLPIVVSIEELDILINGCTEIREVLAKERDKAGQP